MSNIFCLWSGGLDSTYLVDKLLRENHTVIVGWCDIQNNHEVMKREYEARTPMIEYFLETYSGRFINMGKLYSINVKIHNDTIPLKQAFLWMMSYLTLPNYSYRKIDKLALGYVMNDDALSYLDEFKSIFKTLNEFADSEIELIFPVIKYRKTDMYLELPNILKDNITWCDTNEEILNPCGKCDSCKRMTDIGISKPFNKKQLPVQENFNFNFNFEPIKDV